MEKLIVSPGFVKKIEDEQDTQDQAITSNSQAIANINPKKDSINDLTETQLLDLVPGNYSSTTNATNNLPTTYGNLTVMQSNYGYGAMLYEATNNTVYFRAFYKTSSSNKDWRGSWQELATKSDVDTRVQIFKTGSVSANSSAVVEAGRGRMYLLVCGGAYATGSMYIIFGWTAGSGRVQTVKANSAVTVSMDSDRKVTIASTENISYSFVDIGSFA